MTLIYNTKIKLLDNASSPTANGELVRNGALLEYHDGTSSRVLVNRDLAETLTNKTLTSPILTTPALGTPASGVITSCTGTPTLTATNITGLVATTGLTATGTKDSTTFLRGDDTWATVPSTESMIVSASDETTALTTGTAKTTWRMPYAFTLTAVKVSLTTTSSSGNPTIDINESGTSILSSPVAITAGQKTATATVGDPSLANLAEMTIDIDVAGTGATGLKIYLIGYQS